MRVIRVLKRWRRTQPPSPNPETVDRLVAEIVEDGPVGGTNPADGAAASAEVEMRGLIASIREIGTDAPPLDEAQVDAIMSALPDEAGMRARKGREVLGVLSGFVASALTLAAGLLLSGPAVGAGSPPDLAAAATVATLAAAAALLLHGRSRVTHAVLPALAVLAFASCDTSSPESSTSRIDSSALTVFQAGESLWGVRDIVQSGSVIWALTEAEPFLRAYDPSGRLLAEFGNAGEGPGELRNPQALSATASDQAAAVWDLGSASLAVFNAQGDLVSTTPMPIYRRGARLDIRTVTFGDPFRLVAKAGATLVADYATGPNLPDDMWSGRIVRVADGGSDPVVLVDFATDLEGSITRSTGLMALAPVPLWDACPDGRVAVLDPVAGHLRSFGGAGTSDEPIPVPWKPRPLRTEELVAHIRSRMQAETRDDNVDPAEIERAAEAAVASAGDRLPAETPLGVSLLCAAGRVWIQEFDGLAHPPGYGSAWWSVDLTDGAARAERVVFPDRFTPFQMTDSTAIGVITDSVELQRVAVVRLPG